MGKTLVTYFTASTGKMTGRVAGNLADAIGADLFEMKPVAPYTAADINWLNPLARCNREMLGKKDVPVEGKVENMAEYDLLLIGFPIWYGCAPNIVNTFVKGYDLSGKKIALFATSGGGGMGKSAEKLKPYLSETARIVGAKLFSGSASADELKVWVDSLSYEEIENELREFAPEGDE